MTKVAHLLPARARPAAALGLVGVSRRDPFLNQPTNLQPLLLAFAQHTPRTSLETTCQREKKTRGRGERSHKGVELTQDE